MTRTMKVDLFPKTCNICGGKVVYITNDKIYGKKYGSGYCYLCLNCHAMVGTHKPRPKEALGLLANDEMKKLKIACHEAFDTFWKGKKNAHNKRNYLYALLAKDMNIPIDECHFGYFDLEQLKQAQKIISEWKNEETEVLFKRLEKNKINA